ncbi:MAG TPA: protein kinase, partial [Thermoanaerobaculia bacterium]|nr:protein kinase [Thermoanaerobaculia bacterium]
MSSAREPGSTLDGKYEVVERLGSGGMGEVYLVRHVHLQELRVIKILRQDLQTDPAAQKRFMREARLATQIKHPNVAILYDFATLPEGSFYMVWEHIQGEDIGDWIRRNGPFPVPLAIRLGIQALRGLEAIHATGVIHRDLSPDNLMITEDKQGQKRIKIIDLGLARTLEKDANHEITQVGMFMGKLQYCSPEQANPTGPEGLDRRSDIYSFGLVLYEMITGRPPFESESQAGFIFKRLSEDPLPMTGRNPQVQIPPDLDRVVLRALERDREKRMPDAITFIESLEKVEQSMSAAETREIPIPAFVRESAREKVDEPPAPALRQRSSSELTRAERDDLLAQIDRAARRVQETSVDLTRIEAALAAGNLDEAHQLLGQIEASHPRAQGLQRLKDRLAEERDKAERRRRVVETEQVLANYIQRKQLPLARLALETLGELDPHSPKRAEHEAALARLAQELEQEKRADAALAAGREALARRDLAAARKELETIVRNDPSGKRAAALRSDLEAAEREARTGAELDERRKRFEALLAEHR